ncbi:hypothetical protein RHSIM_Rhsim04G0243100 [Rhododendron simsii]|uniref:S1 motif domain-containing protein n=1 Tax=Rhododendron simsii TaxID=118357 RepID=A0A834LMR4_RHOSS|nr:hypothetical protein RHSIM_Rhsim04G0243100 [Rhododendron simsii]
MASLAQQLGGGLRCPPISTTRLSNKQKTQKPNWVVRAVASPSVGISNAETRERQKLKQLFQEAYERCRKSPLEGVPFTLEDFSSRLENFDVFPEVGAMVSSHLSLIISTLTYMCIMCMYILAITICVKGKVYNVDGHGAVVDLAAKSSAYLPVREACIHNIRHVEEAGIVPGMVEEFEIIEETEDGDNLILSLRTVQYDLAWERCRQLQTEEVVVKGKIVGANKGGVVAVVEGLRGFVPFSQISTTADAEDLFGKEIPVKFVEVDEEESRLVLSNRKAMADSQAQLGIGSVVVGTVQSLKPYGAFIDIGGMNGLLHVSQISHDRVADIATVLQPGDTLKVMILSHDRERGRVSLSTKKLEPTPGDMVRNPELVFAKAEEMAQTFRQRIAQAEAMARADMLRFQPESGLNLSVDGILGSLVDDLPVDGIDLTDIPPAEDL